MMKPPLPLSRRGRLVIMILVVGLLALLPLVSGVGAQASRESSTIRGKVQRQQGTRVYAAPNIRVTLTSQGRSARPLLTYTGTEGMYYFRSVPPGAYRLEVWLSRTKPVASRSVSVERGRAYVDVPPITI